MRIKRIVAKERYEQEAFVQWLKVFKPSVLNAAVPNGGSRHPAEALNLQKSGVKRGFPDLVIPMPHRGYHGCFIEMKRLTGSRYAQEQKWWLEELSKQGYKAEFAKGFDGAKEILDDYFRPDIRKCCPTCGGKSGV